MSNILLYNNDSILYLVLMCDHEREVEADDVVLVVVLDLPLAHHPHLDSTTCRKSHLCRNVSSFYYHSSFIFP